VRQRSRRARLAAAALNGSVLILSNGRRILLSSATGLLALTSVALGTYAGFTAQTAGPGNTFSTGSVALSIGRDGPSGSGTFTFGTVADMVPGESVVKFLVVSQTGTLDFGLTLQASAPTTTSQLNTDATNGLQLSVKQCAGSATFTAVDTCSSGSPSLLYSGSVASVASSATSLGAVTAATGGAKHLQLSISLPSTTAIVGPATSTVELTWTASNT